MNKIMICMGLCVGMLHLCGCMEGASQPFEQALSGSQVAQKPDSAAMNRRFQDTNQDNPTAAESAIELSTKYAALIEETGQLKLEYQNLLTENKRLAQSAAVVQSELNQAKKELTEANDLLIDMRIELNNWKADVLGFREEMRKASKAQLETLIKILTAMGGEVNDTLMSELNSQTRP